MSHHHQEQQTGLDRRFFHLLRWELHHLRGRRRGTWWALVGLLALGFALAVWWAASQPAEIAGELASIHNAAIAFLIATPMRDDVANIAQLTFGYGLLRFTAYVLIATAKVILPGLAAGVVAGDRRTGRLQGVQLTTFSPREIYLAKVLAPALLFLLPGAILLTIFSGIVLCEYVPISEVARLCVEAIGQILLLAFVTVTCSALFSSTWVAMVVAYLLLWLLFPFGWAVLLGMMDETLPPIANATHGRQILGFSQQCIVQAALTVAVCLGAFVVGVGKLHSYGFWGVVRCRLQRLEERNREV